MSRSRRQFIGTASIGALGLIAGCTGDGNSEGNGNGNGGNGNGNASGNGNGNASGNGNGNASGNGNGNASGNGNGNASGNGNGNASGNGNGNASGNGNGGEYADYPSSDIRIVASFGAGGGTDTYTRQYGSIISENYIDPTITVDNNPGSGTMQWAGELAQSEPDGYTLGTSNIPSTQIGGITQADSLDFEPKELTAIAGMGRMAMVVGVGSDTDVDTFAELIEQDTASNVGVAHLATSHLGALVAKDRYGWDVDIVGYDGGGPGIQALASGEVDAFISGETDFVEPANEGLAKVVGVLHSAGSTAFPDVQTVEEQGFESMDVAGGVNQSVYGPPDLPDEIIQKVEGWFEEASQNEDLQQWGEETGNSIDFTDHETLQEEYDTAYEELPEAVNFDEFQ